MTILQPDPDAATVAPMIPTGAEACRPFLPAKDFDVSRAFYKALGFETLLDSEVAIFGVGKGAIILQRHYQKEWAEIRQQLERTDVAAYRSCAREGCAAPARTAHPRHRWRPRCRRSHRS
jgi:hypothetical protein